MGRPGRLATIDRCAPTAELREGFLSFFQEKGHLRRPSGSLIPPADDPSTLFIVAGMQPMKKWFLGLDTPPARTGDDRTEGDARRRETQRPRRRRHHRQARVVLRDARQLLVRRLLQGRRDRPRLGVRHRAPRLRARPHSGPPSSRATRSSGSARTRSPCRVWLRVVGVPRERIVGLPRSENFWQAADTGPCGPDSELYYDRGDEHGCGAPDCAPGCERCERYLEFWNLVFMEFDLGADGSLTPLPQQNIDTGLGLERGAMLLQGVDSIYDTDGYQQLMDWVAAESGVRYGDSPQATKAHRVLADHGRAMSFLIADGVTPANDGRGYIVRRLIRRAVQQGRRIGLDRVYRLPRSRRRADGGRVPRAAPSTPPRSSASCAPRRSASRETVDRGMKVFDELAGDGVDQRRTGLHARRDVRLSDRAHRRARRGARPAGRRRRLPRRDGTPPRDLACGRRDGRCSALPTSRPGPVSRPTSSAMPRRRC